MKILNEYNEEITLYEALQLLEKYDQFEELRGLVYKIANKANLNGSAYSHDYGDLIEKHNKEVFTDDEIDRLLKSPSILRKDLIAESKSLGPEIGDIAYLKIKLRNSSFNKKKNIFEGYERRPVFIIKVNGTSVDGLELTHVDSFKGMDLIPLGRLDPNDIRESFLNIYTYKDYINLDCTYDFPLAFDNQGRAKTKYELQLERFGKIFKDKNGDSPFIVKFDYSKNYLTKLSKDQTEKILNTLKEHIDKEFPSKNN